MKQFFIALALGLALTACSSEIQENRETRSTVYEGQTTWDLYENFGVPTKAERISEEEIHFYYHREAITRDWTRMYYDWCDMTFVVVNDRVVDWWANGNQCFLNVGPGEAVSESEAEEEYNQESEEYPSEQVYEDGKDSYYPPEEDSYRDTLF